MYQETIGKFDGPGKELQQDGRLLLLGGAHGSEDALDVVEAHGGHGIPVVEGVLDDFVGFVLFEVGRHLCGVFWFGRRGGLLKLRCWGFAVVGVQLYSAVSAVILRS